jgi:hypothetical protein
MPIFLSYSRKDEAVVKVLAQGFEAAHREVWFDQDLGGGDAWWDKILENIRSATVFVFALSDESLNSRPCRAELDYARALNRPVLPVQVGRVTNFLSSPVADLQTIRFQSDNALAAFEIIAAIDEEARQLEPLPEPLPPPPLIPFAYLLALSRQIDSTTGLEQADQTKVVDQLRRAIAEETDENVRREILANLQNLITKPWRTKRTEVEARAIIYAATANATDEQPIGERPQNDPPKQQSDNQSSQNGLPKQQRSDDQSSQNGLPKQQRSDDQSSQNGLPKQQSDDQSSQNGPPDGEAEQEGQREPIRPETPRPDGHSSFEQRMAALREQQEEKRREQAQARRREKQQEVPVAETWAASRTKPAAGSANRPPPARFWPGVSNPLVPPPAPPVQAVRRPAEQSHRPERTAGAPTTQTVPQPVLSAPQPPEYWVLSAIALLFFLVFGAVALYFSYQVGQRYRAGNLVGAIRASKFARAWGIAGIVIGSLITIWLLSQG